MTCGLEVLIDAKRVVAVGECDLHHQHYTSKRDIELQAEVFENQLQLAKGKHIPVVIHCRGDEQLNDLCLFVMVKYYQRIIIYTDIV
jgi:Tat protein secretion system quality control protein TatD with DNase activity